MARSVDRFRTGTEWCAFALRAGGEQDSMASDYDAGNCLLISPSPKM
jgi:hypothetical protein